MELLNIQTANEVFSSLPTDGCEHNISEQTRDVGESLLPPPYANKSWSFSRDELLRRCNRAYFYQYFLSNAASNPLASERAKLAKQLKNLTTKDLFIGGELHRCIKEVLLNLNKREYTPDQCKSSVYKSFEDFIDQHNNKGYKNKFKENPTQNLMLQEIYYGESITENSIEEIRQKIDKCIDNFFACETYINLKGNSKLKILKIDPDIGQCILNLNGVKGFFKLDLLYLDTSNETLHVVDWKTGKFSAQADTQMELYMYYISEQVKLPSKQIWAHTEYLKTGAQSVRSANDSIIEHAKQLIYSSLYEMDKYLLDVNSNQPKSEATFLKCTSINTCRCCKYRELCN